MLALGGVRGYNVGMTNNINTVRNDLITSNLGLVYNAAKKFNLRGPDFDEAVSAGMVAIVKAADTFDPSRGFKFSTYATTTIINEIRMTLRSKGTHAKYVRQLAERTSPTDVHTDPEFEVVNLVEKAMRDAQLSSMEVRVIECRYGIGCKPMTLKETAAAVGLTLQQVHATERGAMERMREEANK